jgi:carboxyl-terminal processing protease
MKQLFYLVLCCLIYYNSQAQTKTEIAQLATLCKVWGFLKCFHPAVAQGNPDWDSALLYMIPLAEKAGSKPALDSLLEAWYRSLPLPQLASTPVNWKADSIIRTFTEQDIQRFAVSKWLKAQLMRLYHFHLPDTNRYATRYYNGYRYDHIIHDEKAYDKPLCPTRSVRLLALFRYWNTINYFYPHKACIPQWDTVLTAYIRPFLQADNVNQYQQAVLELIHELPDSHSFINGPGINDKFPPFRIEHVKDGYLVSESDDSVVKRWDVRVGDEIITVNGKSVQQREKELLKITTGTNTPSLYRNIARGLLVTGDSIVQVGLKRKGELITRTVTLHNWEGDSKIPRSAKPLWQELEKGIWYVRFCRIKNADTLRQLFSDLHQARAVIWEMRGYPNYNVSVALNKFLFPIKTMFSVQQNVWDYYPGAFVKSSSDYFIPEGKEALMYTGPLIILVDEQTQSLSESVTMALKQCANSYTIGRQTAGTTGNITWLTLPGALEVSYTGVGVTGAQGSFRQGEGIKLDLVVPANPEYLLQGRDLILEKVLLYARQLH